MISLLERATSPLPAVSMASAIHPLWGPGARALITSIEAANPEGSAATVTLRTNRRWQGHDIGQYLTLGVDVDGVLHHRSFTATSLPSRRGGIVQITVQASDAGTVSPHLVHHARPGDLVHLAPASGTPLSTWDGGGADPGRWLFLTAGSGLTPALAALRAADNGLVCADDVVVVHSARSEARLIRGDELRELTSRPGRQLHLTFTDSDKSTASGGRSRHLDAAGLEARCPDWRTRRTVACGPPGMVEWCEQHWQREDLIDRLRIDRFATPANGLSVVSLREGTGGHVSFTRSDVGADSGASTLLDTAESLGLRPPTGCRQGICHTCTTPLLAGDVIDIDHGRTSSAGDQIRLCVSLPVGDVEVDL